MVQPWQFISSRPDGRVEDSKSRKLVRANASKAFRRGQRLQMVRDYNGILARAQSQSQTPNRTDGNAELQRLPYPSQSRGDSEATSVVDGPRDRKSIGDHAKSGEGLSLEIGSGLSLDPFASTAMCGYYDSARLFSHCTWIKSGLVLSLTVEGENSNGFWRL